MSWRRHPAPSRRRTRTLSRPLQSLPAKPSHILSNSLITTPENIFNCSGCRNLPANSRFRAIRIYTLACYCPGTNRMVWRPSRSLKCAFPGIIAARPQDERRLPGHNCAACTHRCLRGHRCVQVFCADGRPKTMVGTGFSLFGRAKFVLVTAKPLPAALCPAAAQTNPSALKYSDGRRSGVPA